MKYWLTTLFTLSTFISMSQTNAVTGRVLDQNNKPLTGCNVSIEYPWGELYKANQTNDNGRFTISPIEAGGYVIKVSYIGYKTHISEFQMPRQTYDIGNINLAEAAIDIDEVEVKGKIPLAQQKGDTTQYNAEAFTTLPDANAEELIEKMPGIIVTDGKVQAQGEDVKEVLVDGRPFFGNDPTAALRNLPAEIIDKIQVFDKASEQSQFTGISDGETTKTLNIITRPETRNGQFGKSYAGTGLEKKYEAGGHGSLFNGNQRISIITHSNNINKQNFSEEDLLGVANSGRRRSNRRGRHRDGSGSDFLVQQQNGIATTHAIGINYNDLWSEKWNVSASYFFNNINNSAGSNAETEYFNRESVSEIYDETTSSITENTNHRFNARLNYKINERNSILIRPAVSIQFNNGQESTNGALVKAMFLLSSTDNKFESDLAAYNFNNHILFRHSFNKPKRTLSVNLSNGLQKNTGDNSLKTFDSYYGDPHTLDTIDQVSNLKGDGVSWGLNTTYTEPVSERSTILVSYRLNQQKNNSETLTYDFDKDFNDYFLINNELSNALENEYTTHQAQLGYNWSKGRELTFMLRGICQWSTLSNIESYPGFHKIDRSYFNFLPFAMIRWNISKQQNLRLHYRSNTSPPNANQLQEVLDNSNPLQLSIGNAGLKPSTSHRLFLKYSNNNTSKAHTFFAFITGSISNNYISNSIYLRETDDVIFEHINLEKGVQLSRPVNVDDYRNVRTFLTYGIPISYIKSNLNIDLTASNTRTPGFINDILNVSKTSSIGAGITISSNISDKVDFTLSSRPSYSTTQNFTGSPINYWNFQSKLKLGWITRGGIVFRTNLIHQHYMGLSESVDGSYLLWSAGVGKKVLKNKKGEITFSVSDILNENKSIKRIVTETYIEDVQSLVLQRYYMLTFTYHFLNFKTAKVKNEVNRNGEHKPYWEGGRK